jgi:hypothetical protein
MYGRSPVLGLKKSQVSSLKRATSYRMLELAGMIAAFSNVQEARRRSFLLLSFLFQSRVLYHFSLPSACYCRMSNRRRNDTTIEEEQEHYEQERHLAEHFGRFLEDHVDQTIDEKKEDELMRKLESDPDYKEERGLIEKATAYEGNDASNAVVYSVEHETLSLRGDLFFLSGITAFAGLRLGRYMWYKRGGIAHLNQQQSKLTRPLLDTLLSCLVGTAASVESLQSDNFVVRQSVAEVPLVSGRSMISDELCKPLIQEYEKFKHQPELQHPRSVELQTLNQFISNCRHRHELEAKLRKERGLSMDSPVSIPSPGVPLDKSREHDDDTAEKPAATREETTMNSSSSTMNSSSSFLPDNDEKAYSTSSNKQQEDSSSSSSFYHAFLDYYWLIFGKAFEMIEDFELRMRLAAIHRKRRKLEGAGKQATRTQQQVLQVEEITARLNHAYQVMRRKALQPDRLYPTETFVLYGPSYNLTFIGESMTAGIFYYILWRHGPRVLSLILSVISKRYRAAPTYTDSVDYKRFGRIHAVGVAWLWYLVPILQKEEETFPTIPLVEGRSHVADEMCDDFVKFFETLHAQETCERSSNDDLKQIYTFVRNCRRRRAYESKLRKERGLKEDQAVAIPAPGVPTDYSMMTVLGADWAKRMVGDQEEEQPSQNKKR